MIIDSHAHYNNSAYKKMLRYLSYDKDGYTLKEGGFSQLMQEMDDAGIRAKRIYPAHGSPFCPCQLRKHKKFIAGPHLRPLKEKL